MKIAPDEDPAPTDLAKAIGARIRAARKAVKPKMTQEQWAEATGISQSTLSNWERGEGFTQFDDMDRGLRALGRDLASVFFGDVDEETTEAVALFAQLDGDDREMILDMLRGRVERRQSRKRRG